MHNQKKKYRAIIHCHSKDLFQQVANELNKIEIESIYTSSLQSLFLEIEKQNKYIILAEFLMPSINGLGLIEKIKTQLGFLPPLAFMLNKSDKDTIEEFGHSGVMDFFYLNDNSSFTINDRVQFLISKLNNDDFTKPLDHKYTYEDFYHLYNDINDFVIIRDMNEQFVFVNESFVNKINYDRSEIAKLKTSDLIAPQEIYNYRLEIQILKEKTNHTYETVLISKNNKLIPVEINSKVTAINNEKVVLSIIRDISNRKKCQKTIKKAQSGFRKNEQ